MQAHVNIHFFVFCFVDSEADDASSIEGRRREEPGAQGGDDRGGGADCHPEAVLPSDPREELHVPVKGRTLSRTFPPQCHDGAEKVL